MRKMITQSIGSDNIRFLKNQVQVCCGLLLMLLVSTASFGQEPAPANDNCDGAVQIACDQPLTGSTIDATAGNTSPSCAGGSVEDLFYTFDAVPGVEYTVSVAGESNYDAVLALFSGACGDEENWIELGCADITFSSGIESASISVDEPTSIIVQTYDWSAGGGDFELSLACEEPAPIPENDLPCDAIAVECGSVVDGSNENATPDARCGSTTERLGVWYVLELGSEQVVSLETCLGQTNFDTDLSVFTGSCDDLTCFEGFSGNGHIDGPSGCDVQSWAAGGDGAVFTAPAGTYYIMVHGFGTTTSGDFTLSVSCEDPPSCTPASDLITEVISDDCAEGEGSYTVVVSFSDDGSAEEYTVSNDINEETAVVAADGSAEFSFPSGTEVNFTAVATGFQDCIAEGSASFTCPPPAPANDGCDGAVQIACDQPVTGSTTSATAGNTSPSCTGGSDQDVFYTFDAVPGIDYTVSVDGESNYDAVLALYSGECSDEENWIELGCADNTFTGGLETVSFSVDEPTSIIVQTYDWYSSGGDFELSLSCEEPTPAPSNDLSCDAIAVECGSVVDGSNVGATPDARCGSTTERLGVWYVLELESEQIVSLETCLGQTNFDTDLSVFTGSCDDLTCFEGFSSNGHIDGPSNCEVQSWAAGGDGAVFVAPAGTYYIMVHGFGSSTSGDFTLSVTCEPSCIAEGGFIGFADESDAQTVCADEAGSIDVIQDGAAGDAFAWVITDEDANVLDLPDGPPFDFSGAEDGTVLIWYLAFDPENSNVVEAAEAFANGAEINAGDLEGCFSLSNSIALTIETCFDCPEQEANEGDACEIDGQLGEINPNCECVPVDVSACNNFVVYLADIAPNDVTDIYEVTFNGSDADLSLIATSETEVHIAYNETNGLIYAVNKADGSYATLDPSTGTFGPLTMIDADVDEIVGAVINADGKLLLSSQSSNTIYSVNLPNSEVSVFDSYSPILGGDIAFGQDGMLYLATREGSGTLFEAYPDEVLADQYVGDVPSLVTGLALASNGQLLVSSRESSQIDVRNTDGSVDAPFNLMLDGESFESFNGDMASGCADNVPGVDECNYALYYTHQPEGGDYSLFSVELEGAVANTTELASLGGSSHIGLSPDGAFIYILGGQNVETYDVALGTIVNSVNIETAGGQNLNGFPAAVVAADGTLYGGSGNKIYSIDPATGIATQFGPNRNVNGGDLIEVAGELWIITRNNNTFTNVLTGDSFTVPVNEINGAAVLENGNVLLADGNGEGLFKEVEIASQSVVAEYETGLELFNGDLAGGCTGGEDEDVCADAGECYGVTVDYVQGTTQGGGALAADRANPMNALGEPEGTDDLVFTTLGYGGSLTFQFDGVVPNGPGDDIEVVETSFGNPGCESFPEYADVSVSVDGATYFYIGTVCKGDPFVDISDADVEIPFECVSYVRVASNDELTSTGDAFDVDGIVALHNCDDDGDDEETALTSVDVNNTLTSFPNPTSGLSQAVFITAETERATLEVYDMNGRVVETLFNQVANANQEYRIDFDGMKLPNGVYVYRLTTDSETIVEKFMIAK